MASTWSLYLALMTRRLSFIVGVSSSDSDDHSAGRIVNLLNCSAVDR